ncbi:SDR family NAD(P)-dependent oxidoreductase [Winogradskya consettensis]|uniref:Short-chain dehydrogenase n=1 Tax=Winogradskya consettensis TaxID=113560 RepID=A0A919S9S1_9ACTN|nr:SDR family oxidoreductase [Actinoplanes consettensis]GIM68502.1 short-chain dehydrogenase [Actinoplanes consettensis]
MSISLAGKKALVTGGTRGIGRGIVLALAAAGADVVTCYRSEGEHVESLARELKELPGEHHLVRADVSVPADIDRLIEECQVRLGGLDIVVNNAGVISHVPFDKLEAGEWARVLDTNLTAAYLVIQKSLPLFGDSASVINVGSRVATVGIPLRAHYTAAKAGLAGLTRSLCKELGPRGIRINVVAPGVIATEAELTPEILAKYESMTALRRLGRTDEIAGAVLFLASDLSGYITGETINVDGGI